MTNKLDTQPANCRFLTTTSEAGFEIGDMVTIPTGRRWWQFWKPRFHTFMITNIIANTIEVSEEL